MSNGNQIQAEAPKSITEQITDQIDNIDPDFDKLPIEDQYLLNDVIKMCCEPGVRKLLGMQLVSVNGDSKLLNEKKLSEGQLRIPGMFNVKFHAPQYRLLHFRHFIGVEPENAHLFNHRQLQALALRRSCSPFKISDIFSNEEYKNVAERFFLDNRQGMNMHAYGEKLAYHISGTDDLIRVLEFMKSLDKITYPKPEIIAALLTNNRDGVMSAFKGKQQNFFDALFYFEKNINAFIEEHVPQYSNDINIQAIQEMSASAIVLKRFFNPVVDAGGMSQQSMQEKIEAKEKMPEFTDIFNDRTCYEPLQEFQAKDVSLLYDFICLDDPDKFVQLHEVFKSAQFAEIDYSALNAAMQGYSTKPQTLEDAYFDIPKF